MTGLFRTKSGGRLDRSRTLSFTFDGQALKALPGDTLASALIANGIHLVGRSFKYHRPRGILSAGAEEPNALVTVDRGDGRTTPNVRATEVEVYEGLTAISQNRWPSLETDVGAIAETFSPLLSAGFYYKTFLQPARFWTRLYEPIIRHAAGMGRAPTLPDPDTYLTRYAHCEVLICGAGPAGLAAAIAASEAGARVIVADEQSEMGGSLLSETSTTIDGKSAALWVSEALAGLRNNPRVRLLPRTTIFGAFPDRMYGLVQRHTDHLAQLPVDMPRETLWQVRAAQTVVATGAIERPLVFADNDRPGIMLADAGRTYLARYGAAPGGRIVVVTACDSAYRAAIELKQADVEVPMIADLRADLPAAAEKARATGIEVMAGMHVATTYGRHRLSAVEIAGGARNGGFRRRIECDGLLMSGGWTPSVHLISQAREPLDFDQARRIFVPGAVSNGVHAAGACNGTFDLSAALHEGFTTGGEAARIASQGDRPKQRPFAVAGDLISSESDAECAQAHAAASTGKAFVDFQNDVTVKDLLQAVREGFRSIEHVKRYTTNGMATDQGKTSNLNALSIVAQALDKPMPEVGLTTYRMPVTPVSFGALAGASRGALFEPVRTTPLHDLAVARGAVFEDVGQWKRARHFPMTYPDGAREDMHVAVIRECRITRAAVGLFDASTLGKIEICGPDAAAFIGRMYANHWPKLSPGQCRYGLMLRDDGTIFDDGIVAMLAPGRYHVTTTTGGAARVLNHMEDYRQTEWPDLDVWLTSVTEQWAVIAVQGPLARETLLPLIEGVDVSGLAMPHMTVREGRIRGFPMRLFRASFTGELGFEVNVPASAAPAVWETIAAQVAANSGTVYGTEAMHVMRAEKGFILVGQETDGTVTADDVGLGAMLGMVKPDFVGRRGALREDLVRSGRKQLVGLLTSDPTVLLQEGAQIAASPGVRTPSHAAGYVTSAYWSAALGRSIALALLEDGRKRHGQTLHVTGLIGASLRYHTATVVDPVFYDPKGSRLRV